MAIWQRQTASAKAAKNPAFSLSIPAASAKQEVWALYTLSGNADRTHGEFRVGETATSQVLGGFSVNVTEVFRSGQA